MAASPLVFSGQVHRRRHGPQGYLDYTHFKPWLRDEFSFRCVYCLTRETWSPDGADRFSVEHFVPQSRLPGWHSYDNLLYACLRCNSARQERDGVLDPSGQPLGSLLYIDPDGVIHARDVQDAPLEAYVEAHIDILALNAPNQVAFRRRMLSLFAEWVEMGEEAKLREWFGYPQDLPDLKRLRPPEGNARPEGVQQSAFEMRKAEALPALMAIEEDTAR